MQPEELFEIIRLVAEVAPIVAELKNYDDPADPDSNPEIQDLKEHLEAAAEDCRAIFNKYKELKGD